MGSGIHIESSKNIKILYSIFEKNKSLNGAGIFTADTTDLLIEFCDFFQNDVLEYDLGFGGGIYSFKNKGLIVQNCQFTQNLAGAGGGGLYLYQSSNTLLQKLNFLKNIASKGGSMTISSSTETVVKEIISKSNKAHIFGGGFEIHYNLGQNSILIQDCILDSNEVIAYGAAAFFHYNQNLIFKNITVTNHTATTLGGALYDFSNDQPQYIDMKLVNNTCTLQGGDMKIKLTKNVSVLNSQFLDYNAFLGGSLAFEIINGYIKIDNCVFNSTNRMYSQYVLVFWQTESIQVSNIEFINNQNSINKVGAMLLTNVNSIHITNSIYQGHFSNFQGGALFFDKVKNITIQDTIIGDSIAQLDGGGIYAINIDYLYISKTKIINNQAQRGGGIFIQNSKIIIFEEGIQLNNNQALDIHNIGKGGGLYLNKIKEVSIQQVTFQKNNAQIQGGGLYAQNTFAINIQNNSLIQNFVSFDQYQDKESKLEGYKLSQGGGFFFYSGQYQFSNLNLANNTFVNNLASSGGGIFLLEEINTQITVGFMQQNIFRDNVADFGPSIRYLGDRQDMFEIEFKYGQNLMINNQFQIGEDQIKFGYSYNERKITDKTNQIELCPPGTFLLEGGQILCLTCPVNGICKGGYQIVTNKSGFWKQDQITEQFYECVTEGICLERGKCKEGHMGIKCKLVL